MKHKLGTVCFLVFTAWAMVDSLQAKNAIVPFGNWNVSGGALGMYAYTTNDSGELLGEYCYYKTRSCQWIIGIHTGCKENMTGVVLANSSAGSMPLDVICRGTVPDSALYSYVFSNWKQLESEFQDASRIGFAVALHADQFIVIRFSLIGRTDAEGAMQEVFKRALKKKGSQGTADQPM